MRSISALVVAMLFAFLSHVILREPVLARAPALARPGSRATGVARSLAPPLPVAVHAVRTSTAAAISAVASRSRVVPAPKVAPRRLAGRVTGASGAPVEGASVVQWGSSGTLSVETDARGAFELDLGEKTTRVVAMARGHSTQEVALAEPDALGRCESDVVLTELATIEGFLRDRGGRPVRGLVRAGFMTAYTGHDGNFSLAVPEMVTTVEGLAHGSSAIASGVVALAGKRTRLDLVIDAQRSGRIDVRVHGAPPGAAFHVTARRAFLFSGAATAFVAEVPEGPAEIEVTGVLDREVWHGRAVVHVLAASTTPVHVVLGRGRQVRGRVVTAKGEGVAGLDVDLVAVARHHHAVTDASGAFAFENVVGDTGELGVTQSRSFVLAKRSPALGGGDLGSIVVEPPRRRVAGTVHDEEGRPCSGARVSISGESGAVQAILQDGSFAFEKLPAGRLWLGVDAGERALAHHLEPGEDASSLDLVPLPRTRLTGRVVDEKGSPLGSIDLRVSDGSWATTARTDARGSFMVPLLARARYRVSVAKESLPLAAVKLSAREAVASPVDVDLSGGASSCTLVVHAR